MDITVSFFLFQTKISEKIIDAILRLSLLSILLFSLPYVLIPVFSVSDFMNGVFLLGLFSILSSVIVIIHELLFIMYPIHVNF